MALENLTAQQIVQRYDQLEKELRAWTRVTKKKILFRIASLNLKDRVRLENEIKLTKSIKVSLRKKGGELEAVSFGFIRHGIFLEHGVGRGRPVGSPRANKSKKVWLKPSMEVAVEELADLLSEKYADIIAAELRILVPGIIDTKITK